MAVPLKSCKVGAPQEKTIPRHDNSPKNALYLISDIEAYLEIFLDIFGELPYIILLNLHIVTITRNTWTFGTASSTISRQSLPNLVFLTYSTYKITLTQHCQCELVKIDIFIISRNRNRNIVDILKIFFLFKPFLCTAFTVCAYLLHQNAKCGWCNIQ